MHVLFIYLFVCLIDTVLLDQHSREKALLD